MLRFGVAVFAAFAIGASAWGETLPDYARVKSAPCEHQCTRAALGFDAPTGTFPNRGVVIMSDGFMSRSAQWEIVDFEKATATILVFHRNPSESKNSSAQLVSGKTLSQEQVSQVIQIANAIWRRKWAGPAHQKPPRPAPMCTDIVNELVLFDGDHALASPSTCPFSEDRKQGWYVEEARLDDWFAALFPPAPTPPAPPN
jgi:hypothetical protein